MIRKRTRQRDESGGSDGTPLPPGSRYDPEWVRKYYDEYGEKEWDRLDRSPADRVNQHIHSHYLRCFVPRDSRVLEIGPGPGRFTEVLAELGCRVVAGDVSAVQLELHRRYGEEKGFGSCVEERLQLDICDLSKLGTESFDVVTCYGGPLSYVFERAGEALRECVRVCRRGGRVLGSVMTIWGTCHRYLPAVLGLPPEVNRGIEATGNLDPATWKESTHHCHMYRSAELRELVQDCGLRVVAMSASNGLSINWTDEDCGYPEDRVRWEELLRMELEACRQPGCLDMGTHLLFVGERKGR